MFSEEKQAKKFEGNTKNHLENDFPFFLQFKTKNKIERVMYEPLGMGESAPSFFL